jgi:hypothetical protein
MKPVNKEDRFDAWQILLALFMFPVALFVLGMCVVCGLAAMACDKATATSPYNMKDALKFWAWLFGTGFVLYWLARLAGKLLLGS